MRRHDLYQAYEKSLEGLPDGDRQMRYNRYICDTGGCKMPVSLRIPPKKEEMIRRAAKKEGKRKTGFIFDAIDEKLGLEAGREQFIRKAVEDASREV